MQSPRDPVLASVIDAIVPASAAHGGEAVARALEAMPPGGRPDGERELLVHLVERLGAARHTAQPRVNRKHVLICAADHGIAHRLPIAGTDSSSAATAAEVAAGMAAVNVAARTAGAILAVVDCGVRGGVNAPGVVDVRIGNGTADIRRGPAMGMEEALHCLHTGIALMLSLADEGMDCLALGQIAPGSQPVSEALVAALEASHGDNAVITALATRGGYDIGVLAGLILAAAAMRVPVVLDDHGTSAAALVAARMAPAVTGYLIAAHAGQSAIHQRALAMLGLDVLLGDLGLGQGEGMGACLFLPMLDAAARLLADAGSTAPGPTTSDAAARLLADAGSTAPGPTTPDAAARLLADAGSTAPGPTHIFVYGTLRAGQRAHKLITPYARTAIPATVRGRLAALPGGYPGLFEDSAHPQALVAGELVELAEPTAALVLLDEYEGNEYARVCREITLADGRRIPAWCYVLRQAPQPGQAELIDSGDWIAHVDARHAHKK